MQNFDGNLFKVAQASSEALIELNTYLVLRSIENSRLREHTDNEISMTPLVFLAPRINFLLASRKSR